MFLIFYYAWRVVFGEWTNSLLKAFYIAYFLFKIFKFILKGNNIVFSSI